MSNSNEIKIDITYQNIELNEFTVKRENQKFSLYFEFMSNHGSIKAKLIGIRDTDNLCELLHADRIWIKKESKSQTEFGRYTLSMSHEYYSEVVFDQISPQ